MDFAGTKNSSKFTFMRQRTINWTSSYVTLVNDGIYIVERTSLDSGLSFSSSSVNVLVPLWGNVVHGVFMYKVVCTARMYANFR